MVCPVVSRASKPCLMAPGMPFCVKVLGCTQEIPGLRLRAHAGLVVSARACAPPCPALRCRYVESKQGRVRAIFGRLDLDGDGLLDAREVHHAAAGEAGSQGWGPPPTSEGASISTLCPSAYPPLGAVRQLRAAQQGQGVVCQPGCAVLVCRPAWRPA